MPGRQGNCLARIGKIIAGTMGKSLITSYKTAIALLIAYALGLAIATFIEKYLGTQAAKLIIYYSPVFFFWYICKK
jgi:ABC-type phosphate transport system permease subunit